MFIRCLNKYQYQHIDNGTPASGDQLAELVKVQNVCTTNCTGVKVQVTQQKATQVEVKVFQKIELEVQVTRKQLLLLKYTQKYFYRLKLLHWLDCNTSL